VLVLRLHLRRLGDRRKPHADHREPTAGGGASSLDNLRLSCRACNGRKGHLGADAYEVSEQLARRRRQMYLEELQRLGVELP
jgi:5-methylcytosine-specific restriction endonuclease McrA